MADAGMVAGETVEFLIFGDYMACDIFEASPRSDRVAYLCRPDDYLSSIVAKLEYAVAQNRPQLFDLYGIAAEELWHCDGERNSKRDFLDRYYADDVHLNNAGKAKMSQIIYEYFWGV